MGSVLARFFMPALSGMLPSGVTTEGILSEGGGGTGLSSEEDEQEEEQPTSTTRDHHRSERRMARAPFVARERPVRGPILASVRDRVAAHNRTPPGQVGKTGRVAPVVQGGSGPRRRRRYHGHE